MEPDQFAWPNSSGGGVCGQQVQANPWDAGPSSTDACSGGLRNSSWSLSLPARGSPATGSRSKLMQGPVSGATTSHFQTNALICSTNGCFLRMVRGSGPSALPRCSIKPPKFSYSRLTHSWCAPASSTYLWVSIIDAWPSHFCSTGIGTPRRTQFRP